MNCYAIDFLTHSILSAETLSLQKPQQKPSKPRWLWCYLVSLFLPNLPLMYFATAIRDQNMVQV